MICPHCKKQIDRLAISSATKDKIYEEIKKDLHSTSSLVRKLNIKRSTINHHLNQLIKQRKIYVKKLEHTKGRPVILRVVK